jgi:UDP-N-acetylglucosamine 2-epimerase (non-hydrolysing)
MKVVSIVGARPQFVKLAPVAEALRAVGDEHVILHTGQHYDWGMSGAFFEDLQIPDPDVSLGVGSASHGAQTGAMLAAIEPVLEDQSPDWVLVYGDTNSTLAGALAAVKIHLPVAHLEAGLRSFNRRMPEEHNRVLTDHAADLLLAPTDKAVIQLGAEGLGDRTILVGDVMVDVCLRVAGSVQNRPIASIVPELRAGEYIAATLHRADNTDDPDRLRGTIAALRGLPLPVVLPVHPRLRDRCARAGIALGGGSLLPVEPLSYPDMVLLTANARSVVTDSGGLQKEAFVLGVPCTTLRTETEWVETLDDAWNVLAPDAADLEAHVQRRRPIAERAPYFGEGHAAITAVEAMRASAAASIGRPTAGPPTPSSRSDPSRG